ncbi:snRNA-activating protein complex subunit 1-like [Gouania willdenowi]|uniref:snRNA-activating protein complex subunit 1-like n=1 Tax=Gouania willdenowi TaxID=441366 RepID=UPI0010569665|nr:snRNA-activating protein complex subunit 1-like [Gouania willdenowi]
MPLTAPVYSDSFDGLLAEDVGELLARFQHSDSVRYSVFSAVWREMRFSEVFMGINSSAEQRRFTKLTLDTAVKYFQPPYSYQIRVGGLYLLFGLYHAQLCHPPVKIRFCLHDWIHVQNFLRDSVEFGHHDVVYVYQRLLASKAVHFTAMTHFLSFQKFKKQRMNPVCSEFLSRTMAVLDLRSSDLLEEVGHIQNQYETMKEASVEVRGQVSVTHRDLGSRLRDCMTEFISWQEKAFSVQNQDQEGEDEEEEESTTSSGRARLLESIKQRSYGSIRGESRTSRSKRPRRVETVEEVKVTRRKGRPESLRIRTRKKLGVEQQEDGGHPWSLGRTAAPC